MRKKLHGRLKLRVAASPLYASWSHDHRTPASTPTATTETTTTENQASAQHVFPLRKLLEQQTIGRLHGLFQSCAVVFFFLRGEDAAATLSSIASWSSISLSLQGSAQIPSPSQTTEATPSPDKKGTSQEKCMIFHYLNTRNSTGNVVYPHHTNNKDSRRCRQTH